MFIRLISIVPVLLLTMQMAAAQTIVPPLNAGGSRVMTIYSSLDKGLAMPLLTAFQKLEPNVEIRYYDLQTLEIYTRTIEETDAGLPTADLLISSAMDLQLKLANDGYAARIPGTVADWPKWAAWRNSAYGITFEPSVIVYNKKYFENISVPQNRAELRSMLETSSNSLYGKIGTYDIETSGLGYLFLARDAEHDRDIWELVNAMGAAGVKLYSNSSSVLDRVRDGRLALGYNILGSYAEQWAERYPDLGIVHPQDFTVVLSRIALVPEAAAQPELGRRALRFLMSQQGQTIMANEIKLPSINPQVEGDNTALAFKEKYGARLRPTAVGPGLVAYLDQVKRARFIKRWNQALLGE